MCFITCMFRTYILQQFHMGQLNLEVLSGRDFMHILGGKVVEGIKRRGTGTHTINRLPAHSCQYPLCSSGPSCTQHIHPTPSRQSHSPNHCYHATHTSPPQRTNPVLAQPAQPSLPHPIIQLHACHPSAKSRSVPHTMIANNPYLKWLSPNWFMMHNRENS